MQAVGLGKYAGDLAVILAIDWFLDRCRTTVNLLGDSYGTVIIHHLSSRRRPYGGQGADFTSLELARAGEA